ncbi:MAG: hypothetical protein ACLVG5_06400 [Clostridium sp.]
MSPYGTVRLSINPEVELSVNRLDYVLSLSGINRDGEDLIRGYDYKGRKSKKLRQVWPSGHRYGLSGSRRDDLCRRFLCS